MVEDLTGDHDEREDLLREYVALMHAIQTGVKLELEREQMTGIPEDYMSAGPKHLRVGLNGIMCDHGALVGLLIKKGIITDLEYRQAVNENLRAEVARYEKALFDRYQIRIKLG